MKLACSLTVVVFMTSIGAAFSEAQEAAILFDVPAFVRAEQAPQQLAGDRNIIVSIPVSSLATDQRADQYQQWVIRVLPRKSNVQIRDYSPKTSTATELEGGLRVKDSSEKSGAYGVGIKSDLSSMAAGNLGLDRGHKNLLSHEYTLVAPQKTAIASGTIHRGRGVYFKWLRRASQVLEGEKTFRLTLAVPTDWRTTLLDVSIEASGSNHGGHPLFPASVPKPIRAEFVIAVVSGSDADAQRMAEDLSDLEYQLRQSRPEPPAPSLSTFVHQVATKLDLDQSKKREPEWLAPLIRGTADPLMDKTIIRLPMKTRRLAVRYQRLRDSFLALTAES